MGPKTAYSQKGQGFITVVGLDLTQKLKLKGGLGLKVSGTEGKSYSWKKRNFLVNIYVG